jgi:hypothetical protein
MQCRFANVGLQQLVVGVVVHNLRPEMPARLAPAGRAFLEQLWHPDPSRRPCFVDIIQALRPRAASRASSHGAHGGGGGGGGSAGGASVDDSGGGVFDDEVVPRP